MTPHPFDVLIDGSKLTRFLLNQTHKEGWSKAKLLLANGFTVANPEPLARALFEHAVAGWPGTIKGSAYGRKFVIDGPMTMPNGSVHDMRSVWQIDTGSTTLRFITAY